jgi:RNA polymerase sigma-70 factor, ECF subfamily
LRTYRTELNGYCYRLLGSVFEAQDAMQDTMVRAWRGLGNLERPSSLRVWLYRIATNVCFNMITARRRRALQPTWPAPGLRPRSWPVVAGAQLGRADS